MRQKCETKLCQLRKQKDAWLIFKNTYDREPTPEELEVFMEYLNLTEKVVVS